MPVNRRDTNEFRYARFLKADFSGAVWRDCNLTNTRVVGCVLENVYISGVLSNVVVNDVDVTAFVDAELDRRNPERCVVRDMGSPHEFRAAWATVEQLWTATLERARAMPEAALHERVNDEWSFVETLRHLLFASDAWVGRTVLEEPAPFHPLGMPMSGYPAARAAEIGLDLDAVPSLDEVLAARLKRAESVRTLVDGLTETSLDEPRRHKPAPGYIDREFTARLCLTIIMSEEVEHRRFAERDLTTLAT